MDNVDSLLSSQVETKKTAKSSSSAAPKPVVTRSKATCKRKKISEVESNANLLVKQLSEISEVRTLDPYFSTRNSFIALFFSLSLCLCRA